MYYELVDQKSITTVVAKNVVAVISKGQSCELIRVTVRNYQKHRDP